MFVIRMAGHGAENFYTGKKYVFQGEKFAVFGSEKEAKQYTSLSKADKAAQSLIRQCSYCDNYEIENINLC